MPVRLDAEACYRFEDLFGMRKPCVVCGTIPARPHRFTKAGTDGTRVAYLCVTHENQQHAFGPAWWLMMKIEGTNPDSAEQ